MTESNDRHRDLHLDCHTCVAANTTACNDCVVTHLLANDAGPIEFVTTGVHPTRSEEATGHAGAAERASPDADPDPDIDGAVALLAKAGLIDDPPAWVEREEFEPGELSPVS